MTTRTFSAAEAFADFFQSKKIKAALEALAKRMLEGHVCLNLQDEDWAQEQNVDLDSLTEDLMSNELVGDGHSTSPFVLHQGRLYTHRNFSYETKFIQKILALCTGEDVAERILRLNEMKGLMGKLFAQKEQSQLQTIDWQQIACICSFIHRFSIITGGPGTGKTTTVSKLLMLFLAENPQYKIALAAPTGKAASRMKESLLQSLERAPEDISSETIETIKSLEASTIHRLLGYKYNSIHFKHNAENPLDADIIIIDESSMIDMAMFKKLCDAIDPKRSRLILLGDRNQLASVEAGSVFGDLCANVQIINRFDEQLVEVLKDFTSEPNALPRLDLSHPLAHHIVELKVSRRFDQHQGIGKFSKAILENNVEEIRDFLDQENEEQIAISTDLSNDEIERFLRLQIDAYASENDIETALTQINKYKVICATRKGKRGVESLNALADQYLRKKTAVPTNTPHYPNQLIMITENQPDLGLFNGDIGLLRFQKNDFKEQQLFAFFPSSEKGFLQISPARISAWEPAFAITIHKSQGSEFDEVMVFLPDNQGAALLTRELVYTAITRAKHKAHLIADEDTLLQAAAAEVQRISGIRDRIAKAHSD